MGARVASDEIIFPCFTVLPMGFSWSLFLAQHIHLDLARGALEKTDAQVIADDAATVCFGDDQDSRMGCFVYVDNIGVLGTQADQVDALWRTWWLSWRPRSCKRMRGQRRL